MSVEATIDYKFFGINVAEIGVSARLTVLGNDFNFAYIRKGFGVTKDEVTPKEVVSGEIEPSGTIGFHAEFKEVIV